jgi:V8-like Glu-specific endopeptidase
MASDSTAYPYDTVVRITDTIGNQDYQASGVLISPDEVLTASHVVDIAGVGAASNIVVTPAYDDGTAPYGSADGAYFHYIPIADTNGQISNPDSQSDYAVIHLSTPFTGLGTMGLSPNFEGGLVTIAGYPTSANGAIVASTQTVYPDPNYTLLEGVTLGKGSSGGPLFVGGAADPQVVGIVSSESNVDQTGYNTLITSAVFNQIEQWVKADDATATTSSPPATTPTPSPPVTIRDHWFDRRSADLSGLNDWTHRLDANSRQLNNGSMAFVGSPKFQRECGYLQAAQDTAGRPDFPSTFAGWNTSAATNLLHEHDFHQGGDPDGVNWTGQIQAGGSMSRGLLGFADSLQNRIATAGVTHDAWVHKS